MSASLDTLRRILDDTLPGRVRAALAGYARFTADEPPADAKGFAAWHAAAKAALAHVEASVKLLRWAEGETAAVEPAEDGLATLLAQARDAIDQLEEGDEP